MSEIELKKCGRTWMGKDGKEHYCTLPKGHASLICFCDTCNCGKWFGRKLENRREKGNQHE